MVTPLAFWTTNPTAHHVAFFDDMLNDRPEARPPMEAARMCIQQQLAKADILRNQGRLDADLFESRLSDPWVLGYLSGIGIATVIASGWPDDSHTARVLNALPFAEAFGEDQVTAAGELARAAEVDVPQAFNEGADAGALDYVKVRGRAGRATSLLEYSLHGRI